jgi:hypothetical protein
LEDWKIKISVLWLFVDVAYLADLVVGILEPGGLQQYIATGQIGGMTIDQNILLILATALLVPLVMAFLSLVLKDSANRWSNTIVGAVYTILWVVGIVEISATHLVVYSLLLTFSKLVASALIVWYARKSKPKV